MAVYRPVGVLTGVPSPPRELSRNAPTRPRRFRKPFHRNGPRVGYGVGRPYRPIQLTGDPPCCLPIESCRMFVPEPSVSA